jgi:hypothetical protein
VDHYSSFCVQDDDDDGDEDEDVALCHQERDWQLHAVRCVRGREESFFIN